MKLAIVAICSAGIGAGLFALTESWRAKPVPIQTAPRPSILAQPDMTVQHCTTVFKCGPERRYYIGLLRKGEPR